MSNFVQSISKILFFFIVSACAHAEKNEKTPSVDSKGLEELSKVSTETKKMSSDEEKIDSNKELSEIFRKTYQNKQTLSAEFVQKQKNVILNKVRESSGELKIWKPNRFRWETLQPEKNLLIVTSKEVIYYTPPYREGERGQVAIKRAVDVQSNLAVSLLSGGADIAKNFKVKKIESAHFELKPIKSSGDINKIDLYVEKSTNLVYKVLLSHTTKNTTEIELRNVRLGVELSDSIFRFKIPPNTNKID